jgi:hypothetical protein
MAGEMVHRKTNGCTALAADRLGRVMVQGGEPRILNMHSAMGHEEGHTGRRP